MGCEIWGIDERFLQFSGLGFIYIFIHTKCSNKKISKNKDALSVSGALVARRLK